MIVVFGGINIDLVTIADQFPEEGETIIGTQFITYTGGKGANQAVACSRLSVPTTLIGRVGNDIFASQLIESLKTSGVDTSGVRIDPYHTSGVAVINVGKNGQNRIIQVLGANQACDETDAESSIKALQSAAVLMLQMEVPLHVSLQVAKEASRLGRIVILDPAPARPIPEEMYKYCNYITPNETEAFTILGVRINNLDDASKAADELLYRGANTAIIKMGGNGAYFSNLSESGHIPAFEVVPRDTVAAGDAFNAGLAVALNENKPLREAVRWACATGALSVTKSGAQDSMPQRYQVEELVAKPD
ncbi:ribokinase [Dehalococcoidia bacterium]|nr:ribokinase [Dehalococcoidia bacterium]